MDQKTATIKKCTDEVVQEESINKFFKLINDLPTYVENGIPFYGVVGRLRIIPNRNSEDTVKVLLDDAKCEFMIFKSMHESAVEESQLSLHIKYVLFENNVVIKTAIYCINHKLLQSSGITVQNIYDGIGMEGFEFLVKNMSFFTPFAPLSIGLQFGVISDEQEKIISGINEDDLSMPAPFQASDTSVFDINSYSQSIGYISGQGDNVVCTAFLISQGKDNSLLMTSRHALNDMIVQNLNFVSNAGYTFKVSQIVELGDQFILNTLSERNQQIFPDYILLKLDDPKKLLSSVQALELACDEIFPQDNRYKVLGYSNSKQLSNEDISFANSSNQQSLVISYYANTQLGFSGAPLIDVCANKVVGIHCKTTLQPIAEHQRTALSINYLITSYPNSLLAKICLQNDFIEKVLDDTVSFSLPNITSIIDNFAEREESGLRDHGLGATPKLGSSYTYRCMLARWLLKGETKIKFSSYNDATNITYDSNQNSYVIRNKDLAPNKKLTMDESDLTDQCSGKPVVADQADIYAARLVNLFFAPEYWKVKLRKIDGGQKKWVELIEKITNKKNTEKNAVHMGHKLSASQFWLDGSKQYKDDCIARATTNAKQRSTSEKDKKVAAYNQRYDKYETPGHITYGMPINEQFMQDPTNYRFEWGPLNSKRGAQDRKKIGNYADKCPPGLTGNKKNFVPK